MAARVVAMVARIEPMNRNGSMEYKPFGRNFPKIEKVIRNPPINRMKIPPVMIVEEKRKRLTADPNNA
jgi:hypothetical protein